MTYRFNPLPTDVVRALQAKQLDAYDCEPEEWISDGSHGCRHCLRLVPDGTKVLLAALRPFTTNQPYAETGPLFVCAEPCEAGDRGSQLPELLNSERYLMRGYDSAERIIYGTGAVVELIDFPARLDALFKREDVVFVDIRSAANNCFQCRVVRA